GFEKGIHVDYTLPDKAPNFAGRECLIPDAWTNSDLKYTVTPDGVKGDILLKAPGHPTSFIFPLKATGCTPQLEGQWLRFYCNGEPVGRIHPATMVDSSGQPGQAALGFDGGNVIITPDPIWLASATYPIKIDPTTTLQPDATAGKDAYVYQGAANSNYGTAPSFASGGYSGQLLRSFLQFDISGIVGNIDSAILTLYCVAVVGSAHSILAKKITSSWVETTVTYGFQPTIDNVTIYGTTAITTQGRTYDMDITVLTQAWKNGTFVNNGFIIDGDTTASYSEYASSDNSTTANRPKLVITYTESGTNTVPPFGPINALGRRLIA
ncbi:MAG: DNRLRE domain-containing protein, partial [Carboxydocellales bacterium]